MIAITFALPTESVGVLAAVRDRREEGGIVYGKLANRDVAIFHTGVGRKACQLAMERFLPTLQPSLLISAGFAGGIDEKLCVGDRFVAENFSDAALLEFLHPAFQQTTLDRGKLFTASSVIDSPEARDRIARENGASAVDMETEVIALACHERGIRLLSIRAISDTSGELFPLPPSILFDIERQTTRSGRLIWYLITHPAAIPRLLRFASQIKKARRGLTADIYAFVYVLGDPDNKIVRQ